MGTPTRVSYRQSRNYKIAALLLIPLLVIGIIYSLNASLILLSLVMSYALVRYWLDDHSISRVAYAMVGLVFYAFVLLLVCTAVWAFDSNFPLSFAIPIAFALMSATLLPQLKKPRPSPIKNLDTGTVIAVIIAISSVALLCMPVYARFHQLNGTALIGFVDGNVDDSAHIEAINDRLEYNRAIFYNSSFLDRVRSLSVDNSNYPTGWHSVNASLIQAVSPDTQPGSASLSAYILTKLFWFAALVFFFVYSVFMIVRITGLRITGPLLGFLVMTTLLFGFYFLLDTFRQGFYTFIPQLIAIPLIALSLSVIIKTKDVASFWRSLPLPVVLCAVGGLVWLLLLPVTVLALLTAILFRVRQFTPKQLFSASFWTGLLHYVPLYFFVLLGGLVQAWVSSKNGQGVDFLTSINALGEIARYNKEFYLVLIGGVLALLSLTTKESWLKLRTSFYVLTLLLGFALIIYLIQVGSAERLNYYYFKTLNIFTFWAIPLAIVGMCLAVDQVTRRMPKGASHWMASLLFIGLIVFYIGVPAGSSPTVSYLKGKLGLSNELASYAHRQITSPNASSLQQHSFYYDPTKPYVTDITNMLVKTMPPEYYCFKFLRPSFYDGSTPKQIVINTKKLCSDYSISIYTNPETAKVLALEKELYSVDNLNVLTLPNGTR